MQVKMKTLMCGPMGTFNINQIADLPDQQAKQLIAGGYAEAVGRVQAAPGKKNAAKPDKKPVDPGAVVSDGVLLGSGSPPEMIDIAEDLQVRSDEVIRAAFEASGLTEIEWNALPEPDREERLVATVETMRAAAQPPAPQQ